MKNNILLSVFLTMFLSFTNIAEAMSQGALVMTTKNTFLGDLKSKNIFIEIDINNINKIIYDINKLIKKPSLLKKNCSEWNY